MTETDDDEDDDEDIDDSDPEPDPDCIEYGDTAGGTMTHDVKAWHEGNGRHGLVLEFWGDHRGHEIIVPGDSARFVWDDISRVLTVDFEHGALSAATEMYWRLLTIVPALRDDRR